MKSQGFAFGKTGARCRGLAVVALLAAGAVASLAAEPAHTFESELARLAGRAAMQCGIFRTGADGRIVDDPHAGWQCALESQRKGEPYWFALEGNGEDSTVGMAAIRTPTGENLVLHYDSNPGGGRLARPAFRSVTCEGAAEFLPTEWPPIRCGRPALEIGVTNDAFTVDGKAFGSRDGVARAIRASGATACRVLPGKSTAYRQVEMAMQAARDAGCWPGIVGNKAP